MSDDQGDAEFEASLAGIDEGRQHAAAAPAGSASRELAELRATIEALAARMGAGFREDLAQIRAIATSVAERDLTDDVRALHQEIAALGSRDVTAAVREDLAAVRAEVGRLASADAVTGVREDLGPVRDALDRIAQRLDDDSGRAAVLQRFQALESRLDAITSGDRSAEVVERLDALTRQLDDVAGAAQVSRLAGDLRAHLADALGGLDGDALLAELTALRAQLGTEQGTVVEQLQDHLADVASGEVVGALWEEVREVRAALPQDVGSLDDEARESLAALRAEVEGIGAALAARTEPTADPAVAGLRNDVHALADEVRAVLEAAAMESAEPAVPSEDRLGPLADELATLRAELSEGLVVEPSDALSASLDALKAEVDGLRDALAELHAAGQSAEPTTSGPAEPSEALTAELQAIRAAIDTVQARLDEGLVLAEDAEPPAPGGGVDEVVDQVAALRDFMSSELDGLRQSVAAGGGEEPVAVDTTSLDEAVGRLREELDRVASLAPSDASPSEVHATVDPETVDLLREEIRAASGVADQVIDALREELKALRRRLAVKAAERVLDDQQLAQIADAVAERLGRE